MNVPLSHRCFGLRRHAGALLRPDGPSLRLQLRRSVTGRTHSLEGRRENRRISGSAVQRAFVLWEMMLALMIFSVVAVSLTTALHQTIDSATFLRDESQVRHDLENILAESSVSKLKPGKDDLHVGDGRIQYEREVTRIQPRTVRGELLSNLLQVTVRATWQSQGKSRSSQAQVVVYQP